MILSAYDQVLRYCANLADDGEVGRGGGRQPQRTNPSYDVVPSLPLSSVSSVHVVAPTSTTGATSRSPVAIPYSSGPTIALSESSCPGTTSFSNTRTPPLAGSNESIVRDLRTAPNIDEEIQQQFSGFYAEESQGEGCPPPI
jgi:hypothetical protein